MKKIELLPPINYKENLLKRKTELEHLIKQTRASLEQSKNLNNSGHIRIAQHYNKAQFYLISEKGDTKGKYLPKDQHDFAISLIQFNYKQKTLKSMEEELFYINKLLSTVKKHSIETINKRLSPLRRTFLNPLTLSDEEFIEKWSNVPYKSNPFEFSNTEYYTNKNERVRSKSEVIIANLFIKHNIPYKYEYPFFIRRNNSTYYPDFYCLNTRTRNELFWEHFGLMDDVTYAQKAFQKIQDYAENGLYAGTNIIYTFETSQKSINIHEVENLITHYLT